MCGAKRFMLNKNLFKRFSLSAFVMFFCFVLVSPVGLASSPNEKTPNGYTRVNAYVSTTEAECNNEEEDLDALFAGVERVQEEPGNQPSNLTENNNQSDVTNEEESDDESWHEEEGEKSDFWEEEEEEECKEGYNFNIEEESLEEDTLGL